MNNSLENKIKKFILKNEIDALAAEELGSYVYMITDKDDKPFYIGKGTGRRVLQHFEESIKHLSKNSTKLNHIRSIFESSEPKIKLLRYKLATDNNDREALLVEQVAIDLLGINNLVNEVLGHGAESTGTKNLEDFLNEFSAKPLNLSELPGTVLGVKINNFWNNREKKNTRTASSLYDASRRAWACSKKSILELDGAIKIKYVLAIADGIVREVYEVNSWHKDEEFPKRWRFEGTVAKDESLRKLVGKSSKDSIIFGSGQSIAYGKKPI